MQSRIIDEIKNEIATADAKSAREIQLEKIDDPDTLKWVEEQSSKSKAALVSSPEALELKKQILEILDDKRKIPDVTMRKDGYLYNLWKDEHYKQGLMRRTTLEEYKKAEPTWEVLLNLDELPDEEAWKNLLEKKPDSNEKIKWVFGGGVRSPDDKRSLVSLSPNGSDSTIFREFDLTNKTFVKGGFELKQSKSNVSWLDNDSIWVAQAIGGDHVTESGYPRTIKVWHRGESFDEAKIIYQGKKSDVFVEAGSDSRPEGNYHYVVRGIEFYKNEFFLFNKEDCQLTIIPIPNDASLREFFNNQGIIYLRKDWQVPNGPLYPAGSVIALALDSIKDPQHLKTSLIFKPTETCFTDIGSIQATKNHILIAVLNNIQGELYQYALENDQWVSKRINLPSNSTITINTSNSFSDDFMVSYENFLEPSQLCYFDSAQNKLAVLKSQPAYFDATNLEVHQLFAISKDGTKIPYSVIHAKNMQYDGSNPTLLYGYGGFEISELPAYSGSIGKGWLEKGGVWVTANIRGGGEFGPQWHQAGLLEKRQVVFDDFYAVAEDLIKRKITSSKHLGCMGGSNGGLLVGVAYTQRPELFNAVVCQVPLLDMLNYHTMLAGNSWIAEYGDPSDPKMREVLRSYSPYHNVLPKETKAYPPIYISTSTADDRVHPGHSRKMADKLLSMGHKVFYFEDTVGGHGCSANNEQHAEMEAMDYTFIRQQLMQNKLTLAPENDESKAESSTAKLFAQLGSPQPDMCQLPEKVTSFPQKKEPVDQADDLESTLKLRK